MSDYADGKNVLLKRPQPGRPAGVPKEPEVIDKEEMVNVDAIANAVIKAINDKMPVVRHGGATMQDGSGARVVDDFDNSKTLERLADNMTVQGGDSESNFEDLGKVKINKKDQKDVQSTIDLLSDID